MILALAPHTDDVVLGAGGYVAKAVESGIKVHVLAFSTGHADHGSNNEEYGAAMAELGVYSWDCLAFDTHAYNDHRQQLLEIVEGQIARLHPDTVLIPAHHDHQDHCTVRREACRAVRSKPITILGYDQPWHQMIHSFRPVAFAILQFRHVARKLAALRCFESQADHQYTHGEYVIGNARRWGLCVQAQFAEAYEVVKWVI